MCFVASVHMQCWHWQAKGIFQSHLVASVLATHYHAIAIIHPNERAPGQPIGALGLRLTSGMICLHSGFLV